MLNLRAISQNEGVQETSHESRGKRQLKTPTSIWNNNIKMSLEKHGVRF